MVRVRHIRRPDLMARGANFHFGCDCGFEGKVAAFEAANGRPVPPARLRDRAEKAWIAHVPARERETYLLVDGRAPEGFETMQELLERKSPAEAATAFKAQRPVVGNYLMPIGTPVQLLESDLRDGVHYGKFRRRPNGPLEELPIGEVRTSDSRVFRLE